MAKAKPANEETKRYGTLIRVTVESAETIKEAASFEQISVAEFVTLYLLPVAQKRFKDSVLARAKKMEGR